MKIIIANSNSILNKKFRNKFHSDNIVHINDKSELTYGIIKKAQPKFIFFPHWSYIIPSDIFENFNCIVFHMTDLPFGRGGSPLQNLISRGIHETKISAIKVVKELDAGPVYLKRDLSLYGTAEEIYLRAGDIIIRMIEEIMINNPIPQEQIGEPTTFKRRKPEMSKIENLKSIEQLFDFIRMLDAEGYPKAFLENENFRFEFSRASLKSDNTIITDVRISKK
jgi:methionyl-tRNA formyltransferase